MLSQDKVKNAYNRVGKRNDKATCLEGKYRIKKFYKSIISTKKIIQLGILGSFLEEND
jgi:hypothetical protein